MNNRSANDGENNQVPASRNVPIADHGHALGSNIVNENPQAALIPLQGCCKSEACELLNDPIYWDHLYLTQTMIIFTSKYGGYGADSNVEVMDLEEVCDGGGIIVAKGYVK
ncbi:hypothetical protein Acr_23g0017630 [Actinidia rufa]|uniref:Uncharacterized protein n=1 Tax=Actinidia rufa TaxID=165716 RepID=A0A7J0GRJ0_9ERIC|nr:hypothetical protein Acr_23g0017630 [Actinidia rufa]